MQIIMKKNRGLITVVLFVVFFAAMRINAETQNKQISENENYSLIDGIERGFANIVAGWIEVPRGMVYYSVDYPVIGIIPGALEGAGMTLIRTLGGAIDILTIGYLEPGNTVYDTMDAPMLPWESPWLPVPENDEDLLINNE